MPRTFAILCLIAGISLAPLPLHAQGGDGASEHFVEVFLGVKKAEDQEKSGDLKTALATYKTALGTLMRIKQDSPKWQPDLVDFRIKSTMAAVDRVQERMGGGGKSPAGTDPGLGLPPLPLDGDPLNPPMAAPRAKSPRSLPAVDDENPIAAVQRQTEDLKRQLSDVKDMLREEKQRNEKLTSDIGDAMDARKKAETAQKKAQQLAEVVQASFHELKTKGDENGVRAKELETKLREANRISLEKQAELDAVEERVSQLLDRSREMTKVAAQAGTFPAQVKALQAKLETEQKAGAKQSDDAKRREADLKTQIATLAKDKAESATAVAEMNSLQAKLEAEKKASAAEAVKSKKREEDLKGQIATLTKERKDDREEIVRLRDLNKQTDKLMADNATLLKKLGDAEKLILTFKSTGKPDAELVMLRKQVTDTQRAFENSDKKNASLQSEIGELRNKVSEYSRQIAQFKADKTASAEERKKMEDENRLLQGIVTRVMQEDANRNQRKKMIQIEVGKLRLQSDVLLQQISYLSQPVVKLSAAERKLFRKPVIDVPDANTLVAVKTDSVPQNTSEAPNLESGTTEPPPPSRLPEATNAPATEPAKPPLEVPKADNPPEPAKSKSGDDLPRKETDEANAPSKDSVAPVTGSSASKVLPASVKSIADQAKKAFDSEKFVEAERLYSKSLQIAPNNVYLLSNDAVVKYRLGKFKQSEETFKKALALAPEDAFCWSTIGIVYYQEQKFDEAVNALTKSLAINQRNPTAHNYLGITAAQKGWLEAAEKELESAVQLDPKYGDAWYNLAITLATKPQPDKAAARKAYDKALELGIPKDDQMEELLKP